MLFMNAQTYHSLAFKERVVAIILFLDLAHDTKGFTKMKSAAQLFTSFYLAF